MAVIEKQKMEIIEKGKRDEAEFHLKKISAECNLHELKEESGSVYEDGEHTGGVGIGGVPAA
jgi:hypothetical protein